MIRVRIGRVIGHPGGPGASSACRVSIKKRRNFRAKLGSRAELEIAAPSSQRGSTVSRDAARREQFRVPVRHSRRCAVRCPATSTKRA